MVITIMLVGNVVLGFFVCRTWDNVNKIRKQNELNNYPTWAKAEIILVSLLILFSFVLQIISFIKEEYKMGMSMLLLACVLQYVSANLLKPREESNKNYIKQN